MSLPALRKKFCRHPATLAVAAFVAATASFATASDGGAALGSVAPDCILASLGDGPSYDIHQFRGKVVYVDFWASWCAPCVKSFPFMNSLEQEFGNRGLQVIGVNVDAKAADAKAFLVKHPAQFAIGADRGGVCPRSYDVPGMPTSYLLDRKGIVRYQHVGFRPEQADEIKKAISNLLAESE